MAWKQIMLSQDQFAKLKLSLTKHEGCRNFPYVDTVGKITIGIGYNLTDRGLDDAWINTQYTKDVEYFYNQFYNTFPWFKNLNDDRQIILVDMAFMGWKKILQFKAMLDALEKEDYALAAKEMLNSEWAIEVKNRAIDLAKGMETGIYKI
jgi:lysozyme